MSNLKSRILSVCAWVFGVIFIISGITVLTEGWIFTGLLTLVGACLLLPPIKRLISHKKPSLSGGKLTVAGVVLVLIAPFTMSSYEQDASSIETKSSKQALLSEEPVDADISNDFEPVSSVEIEKNIVASSFDANQYPHVKAEDAQMFFLFANLKLASTKLSDEKFLYLHNIEGIRSDNAFEYKEALDNVEMYREEFRQENIPTKIAVDFVMADLRNVDIKPSTNFTVSQYGHNSDQNEDEYIHNEFSGNFILNSYDFDKKGFSFEGYTSNDGPSCSIQYSSEFPQDDIPKLFYSNGKALLFSLFGMKMNEVERENKCFIPLNDEAVAAKIEAARVDDKIVFTGTSYYSLDASTSGPYGNLDALQVNVHVIQSDRSLSKPLASTFIINDVSNAAPSMYDLTADMSVSNRL